MSSLYERLRSRREAGIEASGRDPPARRDDIEAGLSALSFTRLAPFVYSRELVVAAAGLPEAPWLLAPALERPLFFDTETTGLSGGNLVFLFAAAAQAQGGMRVVQIFLSDFPGEADFLACVSREIAAAGFLVSFNGRAFDASMLAARAVLNRMSLEFPAHHLDLLHIARRLWKTRLGSCSLGELERKVLGFSREHDTPGYLAPEIYAAFLRTGDIGDLAGVFCHNQDDVLSLASLFSHIEGLMRTPRSAGLHDQTGLGLLLLRRSEKLGLSLLEERAAAGDSRALLIVAPYMRRAGRLPAYLQLCRKCYESEPSRLAGQELAKQLEHGARDYEAALDVVRSLLTLTPCARAALHSRMLRLERKASRAGR